ncbi:MAG TPA: hypothetical protein VM925_15145 [Labilithrix sp.]|nr:hypothetical protein [Labilithrix sp.]
MLKRLIVGLLLGAVVGIVLAVVLVQGLGVTTFDQGALGAAGAYLAAAITGVLTGLVAGKPIWSADGKIEAGLKAFFGALLALGGMFVLRQWVHVNVDLTALKASSGEIGHLPAASLPIIAAVLAGFFELDNTDDRTPEQKKLEVSGVAKAGASAGKNVRVAGDDAVESTDDDEEAAPVRKRR